MADWLKAGYEKPLALGHFRAEAVFAEYDARPFDPSPALRGLIESDWKKRLAEADARGAELYDGPLARLVSLEWAGSMLRLRLQRTGYKDFAGTNMRDPSLPDGDRADPLGNSAVVVSADGLIILGRRSARVYDHPGWFHCIGGHLDPEEHADAELGVADTFLAIRDEITEELAVSPEDVEEIDCLGLVRNAETRQPEQLFSARLLRKASEVPPARGEHDELVFLSNSAAAVAEFLCREGARTAPVARAALAVYAGLL